MGDFLKTWLPYTEKLEEDDLGAVGRRSLKWSKTASEAFEASEAAYITFTSLKL